LIRPAIGLIGERIAKIAVEVLDVDHIGFAEAHNRVARGVGRHHRDEIYGFTVHIESNGGLARRGGGIAVGRHRHASHVGPRGRLAVGARRRSQHLTAQIFLREDHRPLLGEERIGAGVVAMNMRVDHDLDGRVREQPDRL